LLYVETGHSIGYANKNIDKTSKYLVKTVQLVKHAHVTHTGRFCQPRGSDPWFAVPQASVDVNQVNPVRPNRAHDGSNHVRFLTYELVTRLQ
jgi:hypothetical protein